MKNGRMKITYTHPITNKRTSISLHEMLVGVWVKATAHENYSRALEQLIIATHSNEKRKKFMPDATFVTLVEDVMLGQIAEKINQAELQ
jgi:hypothetical protein